MDANSGKDEHCSSELVEESNNVDSLDVIVSSGETMQDLGSFGEVIAKIEVDLACSSEKLANLGVLKLYVETRENEFETFAAEKEQCSNDSAQKAMEFELLSVLLDSEVRELSVLLSTLQIEIGCSRQIIPSCEDAGELYGVIEEKLNDAESSLKQSQEQILELKVQSSNLQRILLTSMENVNCKFLVFYLLFDHFDGRHLFYIYYTYILIKSTVEYQIQSELPHPFLFLFLFLNNN